MQSSSRLEPIASASHETAASKQRTVSGHTIDGGAGPGLSMRTTCSHSSPRPPAPVSRRRPPTTRLRSTWRQLRQASSLVARLSPQSQAETTLLIAIYRGANISNSATPIYSTPSYSTPRYSTPAHCHPTISGGFPCTDRGQAAQHDPALPLLSAFALMRGACRYPSRRHLGNTVPKPSAGHAARQQETGLTVASSPARATRNSHQHAACGNLHHRIRSTRLSSRLTSTGHHHLVGDTSTEISAGVLDTEKACPEDAHLRSAADAARRPAPPVDIAAHERHAISSASSRQIRNAGRGGIPSRGCRFRRLRFRH